MRWMFGALLCMATVAAAEEENLLRNGGFENKLAAWFWLANSNRATTDFDPGTKSEGRLALRIEKTGGYPVDVLGQAFSVDKRHRGGRYVVSVRARGEGMRNGWLKFFFLGQDGRVLQEDVEFGRLAGEFGWKLFEREFKVPDEAVSAKLLVQIFVGGGKLWLDDAKVVWKEAPAREPLDRPTRAWLDKNSIALRTLDMKGGLDDLRALKPVLRNVRIVQLGEPSHGDGAVFQAKCRLIRWLHEELGYDVVAFESGFYECDRANASLRTGGDAREAMRGGIFAVWHTRRTLPLFEYMVAQADSRSPLVLAGVDPQQSGRLAKGFVEAFLGHLADAGVDPGKGGDLLRELDKKIREEGYAGDGGSAELFARFAKLYADHRKKLDAKHGKRACDFWHRAFENYRVHEELRRTKDQTRYFNLRDEWQGKNLIWLAEKRFPDRKIVVWAATRHIAHNMKSIETPGKDYYKNTKSWGEYVHEHFGKQCYTVGFAAFGGRAGWWFKRKWTLRQPKAGSIEDILYRYGKPRLFVDLRAKGPLHEKLLLGCLGYSPFKARWPDVIDGLVFIEEMFPAEGMGK